MTYTRRFEAGFAALVAAMLFAALVAPTALAQAPTIPSAEVVPANTSPDDPNGGQWFYLELDLGETATFDAHVRNPAEVPQSVTLYLGDLDFSGDSPVLKEGTQTDVGTWGRAEQDKVLIPPKSQVDARFSITVPRDAEPGDHIGAVVAESQPQAAGQFELVLVAATRLYVTVPGEVRRGLEIESVKRQLNSLLFPSRMTVSAKIRNTGRVRLDLGVKVKESAARGPKVLLSQHSEIYVADIDVPFYGGPISYAVEATDSKSGLVRKVNVTNFAIPWGLLLILAIASLFGFGVKRWWDSRASKMAKLQADIRRLETLIAQRPTGPQPGDALGADEEEAEDEAAAILAALKRARRTQSQGSLERLALALHESGNDALDVLLEALEKAGAERRRDLAEAAASYGAAALLANPRMERLPAAIAAEITLWAARDPSMKAEDDADRDSAPPGGSQNNDSTRARKPPARAKRKPPATPDRTKPKPGRR